MKARAIGIARATGQKPGPKRVSPSIEVRGLNVQRLQSGIKWRGMVHLAQLNEDSESMILEAEWPVKSGRMYYACASTGLLFDKQSGRCLQSSRVTLRIDTVAPHKCAAEDFDKWHRERVVSAPVGIVLKRGPKPKGYVTPEFDDADE